MNIKCVRLCRYISLWLSVFVCSLSTYAQNVWVRPYINGEEIVGATLQSIYSTPENNTDKPHIRWERSKMRNGTPTLVQESKQASSYTLTQNDVGWYFRIIVGQNQEAVKSAWIGPVITTEQAGEIHSYFNHKKSYNENILQLQKTLDHKLKNAIYFTVNHEHLHGSPYAMVNNQRVAFTNKTRPIVFEKKIYVPLEFITRWTQIQVPQEDITVIKGGKMCEIEKLASLMNFQLWEGNKNQSPMDNFRLAHMGEGLVILSPIEDIFVAVKDRDLINEATNQLFDFLATKQQMQWFRDAKFGMFLHWDPSSIAEAEISWDRKANRPNDSANKGYNNAIDFEYDTLYKKFKPTQYNPKEWMSIAKKSGMKYAVLTTKHHASFCNFPSQYDTYTIAESPYKKDIVGMFAHAAHEAGLRLGFYYSERDWYHPYYLTNQHYRYLEYFTGQLKELLTRYGQIDVLWFDGIGNSSLNEWDARTVIRRVKQYQPDIVINNRMFPARGRGQQNKEMFADLKGDFDTPECTLGEFNDVHPWESCMTVANVPNTGWTGSWSYSSKAKLVPIEKSIKYLINNVVKDGNLLYNIGPTPTGILDRAQADIFLQMGQWLKTYAEAIYKTRGGPYINQPWGGSCHKLGKNGKKIVYVHVSPLIAQSGKMLTGNAILELDVQDHQFTQATVIVEGSYNGKKAQLEKTENKYKITLPSGMTWDKLDTVIKLQ